MPPKDKDEEERKPTKEEAIWGSILAMLPTIAGTIPGLLQSRQTGALKRMQRGMGAGAVAARQAGSEAARRVLGASTAQPSSGRGGNIREGIRAAEKMTQKGAQAAGLIGAKEGALATSALLSEEQRRRQLGQQLGTGLGGAGASMLAMLMAARDQGPDLGAEKTGLTRDPMGLREATAYRPPALAAPGNVQLSAPSAQPQAQPYLETGAPGTPENLRPLQPPGVLEEPGTAKIPGVQPTAPQTQLQQPMSQVGQQGGFALPLMTGVQPSPEQQMAQAKDQYVQNTMRKSEKPFSKGGSDMMALKQKQIADLEDWIMQQVELGMIKPEDAPAVLQQMSQAIQGSQ